MSSIRSPKHIYPLNLFLVIVAFVSGICATWYIYTYTTLLPVDYTAKHAQVYNNNKSSDEFYETYLDLNQGILFHYLRNFRIDVTSYKPRPSGKLLSFYAETNLIELYVTELKSQDIMAQVKKVELHNWNGLLVINYASTRIGNNDVITAQTVIDEQYKDTLVPYKGGQMNPFSEEIGTEIKAYFFVNKNKLYYFKVIGAPISKDHLLVIESFKFL